MPVEITMPQLSDTMTEGKLIKWFKKEGDKVKNGDHLADIETDKAVMEQEALDSGTLAAILVDEGSMVPVGAVLGLLATAKENPADVKKSAGSSAVKTAATVKEKTKETVAVGAGQPSGTSEMREPDEVGHGATREPATAVPPMPGRSGDERMKITPVAKRIAQTNGVDLQSLAGRGTGPGGRIIKDDVLNLQKAPSASSSTAALPQRLGSGQKQVIPLTKMRAAIARSLQSSKQTIPHYYETIDADVEELGLLRGRVNDILAAENIRLSLGDFITKAVAVALLRQPALNCTFNGTEITRYGDVHLGIAVAVPDGLIVPVLKNVHLMGIKEIRQRTQDLVERARAGKLKQDEMTGATFTISNLGSFGIREFTAIINPPQVAILAVGAAQKRPVIYNGQITARTMISLTMSSDHRVIDGAVAAEFLRTMKELLEEPAMMMA